VDKMINVLFNSTNFNFKNNQIARFNRRWTLFASAIGGIVL